jgi:hypothetical protein
MTYRVFKFRPHTVADYLSINDLPMPQVASRTGLYFVFDFDYTLTYMHSEGNVVENVDYIGQYYPELYFLLRTLRCFGEVFILSRSPRLALINNFVTNRQFIPHIFTSSHVLGSSGPRETQMSSEAWSDKKTAVLEKMYQTYQPSSKKDIFFFDDEMNNIIKAADAGFSVFYTDPAKSDSSSYPEITMQNIRSILDLLGRRFSVTTALNRVIKDGKDKKEVQKLNNDLNLMISRYLSIQDAYHYLLAMSSTRDEIKKQTQGRDIQRKERVSELILSLQKAIDVEIVYWFSNYYIDSNLIFSYTNGAGSMTFETYPIYFLARKMPHNEWAFAYGNDGPKYRSRDKKKKFGPIYISGSFVLKDNKPIFTIKSIKRQTIYYINDINKKIMEIMESENRRWWMQNYAESRERDMQREMRREAGVRLWWQIETPPKKTTSVFGLLLEFFKRENVFLT